MKIVYFRSELKIKEDFREESRCTSGVYFQFNFKQLQYKANLV